MTAHIFAILLAALLLPASASFISDVRLGELPPPGASFTAGAAARQSPEPAEPTESASPPGVASQEPEFVPQVGQAGKDVVWVPTSPELLEAMLDLAGVTSQDFVMDLGSGDGRNIIAAAQRGASGVGVEYNPEMVALSERNAREAGVADRARFVQGDMYEADISRATVLALFLLPHNLEQLRDKFLAMPPGTRIVMNTFTLAGWEPDATTKIENCTSWCNALLHIVPARVAGTWTLADGQLVLEQEYQKVSGTLTRAGAAPVVVSGDLRAALLTLDVDGQTYLGRVQGDRITGTVTDPAGGSSTWSASK